MSSLTGESSREPSRVNVRIAVVSRAAVLCLGLRLFFFATPAPAQSAPPRSAVKAEPDLPAVSQGQNNDLQASGNISGTVLDPMGNPVARALVKLTRDGQPSELDAFSDDDGRFTFAGIAPGPFRLNFSYSGFAPQSLSGTLRPGESSTVPQVVLAIPPEITAVSVTLSRVELAEAEIKVEEKQRALGFIPNFYVSYVSNAAPLSPRQKFELAWKTTIDPLNFVLTGAFAGLEQARGDFHDYGQGARGYGKRYGAAFADSVTNTFLGGAILPSLFKQDPRYFYKGTGTKRSRVLHALASAVICRNDNGRLGFDYSGIMGSLASGGISTLYYPDRDRGAGLLFEGALIGIGANAIGNLFEEFFVRKLTPHLGPRDPATRDPGSHTVP